ncbi:MAG: hypothetical protein PHP54_03570 [Clostridia bacterium]|nr:hypothetical protein [Clostridia bacterium]
MATQYVNQATSNVTISGQQVNFSSNSVTAQLLDTTLVTLVKTQSSALVVSGGSITYSIAITNLSLSPITNFNFQDIIPTGMTYQTGTFKINAATQTPVIAGQNLSYVFTTLPIGLSTVSFTCNVT